VSARGEGGQSELTLHLAPFDPALHISPFRLFRWLHEAREGRTEAPLLLELRKGRNLPLRLRDAQPISDPRSISLLGDREVVLVDDDGREATALTRRLRERSTPGCERVRALYGGVELYDFALDPQVVGEERFLEPRA